MITSSIKLIWRLLNKNLTNNPTFDWIKEEWHNEMNLQTSFCNCWMTYIYLCLYCCIESDFTFMTWQFGSFTPHDPCSVVNTIGVTTKLLLSITILWHSFWGGAHRRFDCQYTDVCTKCINLLRVGGLYICNGYLYPLLGKWCSRYKLFGHDC